MKFDPCPLLLTRKDKLEWIASQCQKLDPRHHAQAWNLLLEGLLSMSLPEAPMPKFNGLLLAIAWAAMQADQTPIHRCPICAKPTKGARDQFLQDNPHAIWNDALCRCVP